MPSFELNSFTDYSKMPNEVKQELMVVPDESDVRISSAGYLEVYRGGYWQVVGDIQRLFNDASINDARIDTTELRLKNMEDRIAELVRNRELEDEFPDLAAAGEYCEEIRVMLKRANDGYEKMIGKTLEKMEIFKELQREPENNQEETI